MSIVSFGCKHSIAVRTQYILRQRRVVLGEIARDDSVFTESNIDDDSEAVGMGPSSIS